MAANKRPPYNTLPISESRNDQLMKTFDNCLAFVIVFLAFVVLWGREGERGRRRRRMKKIRRKMRRVTLNLGIARIQVGF